MCMYVCFQRYFHIFKKLDSSTIGSREITYLYREIEALRCVLQSLLLVKVRERLEFLTLNLSPHWVTPQNMMSSKSKAEAKNGLIKASVQ